MEFRNGASGLFAVVARARRTGLRRLAVFDTTFVAKIATFLGLLLALRGLAVLVGFLLHVAGGRYPFSQGLSSSHEMG